MTQLTPEQVKAKYEAMDKDELVELLTEIHTSVQYAAVNHQ